MEATVDRFEAGVAVLLIRPEETNQIVMSRELLPDMMEGDIVEITILRKARDTEDARGRVSSLIGKLKEKSDDGP